MGAIAPGSCRRLIRSPRLLLALVALLVFVSGCATSPVADDLAQREANEIVSVLRNQGIEARTEKERGARGKYSVVVPYNRFGEAATILTELGLPAERRATFSDLVAQSGILPSSREIEALRLDRAVAAEIEDLLKGHPAVASANSVVRYRALEGNGAPSVSLVIQKRSGLSISGADIRDMVARSVPGIKSEDVVVSLSDQVSVAPQAVVKSGKAGKALITFLGFWQVPEDQYNSMAFTMIALLLVVALMAGLAGYIYGQYVLSRQEETGNYEPLEVVGGAPAREQLAGPDELPE